MELWFKEYQSSTFGYAIKVKEHVCSKKTAFQELDIVDTYDFGRMLLLDGIIMLSEWDEYVYHEMIVHVPLCCLENPQKVLIIGGGDGGTVREVCKYTNVKEIHLVEIDRDVIEYSKEYLPGLSCKLNDPRLTIYYEDGSQYIKGKNNYYDVIIVDSTDPIGEGKKLFEESFYADCMQSLREKGVFVAQTESPFDPTDRKIVRRIYKNLNQVSDSVFMYLAYIPMYSVGMWSFSFVGKGIHPKRDVVVSKAKEIASGLKYYNYDVHLGAFCLPNFVKDMVKEYICN